jgi:hypothetical protein
MAQKAIVDGRPRNSEWLRRHGLRRCYHCHEAKAVGGYLLPYGRVCETCRVGTRVCRVCCEEKPRTEYGYRRSTCHDCESIPYGARKPRACLRCWKTKPVTAFALGDGRRRGVCDECLDAEAAEKAQREQERASRRSTYPDPITSRVMRRCTKCTKSKDLLDHFYVSKRGADGEPIAYDYYCNPCRIANSTARLRERRKDPAVCAMYATYQRTWRENHPAEYKAAQARWVANREADPVARARYLENQRIRYRLKREREGHEPSFSQSTAMMGPDWQPRLPAAPLAALILQLAERDENVGDTCASLGIDPRNLYAWRTGERDEVAFDVADRVLTCANRSWWDVWPLGEYPEVHEAMFADGERTGERDEVAAVL